MLEILRSVFLPGHEKVSFHLVYLFPEEDTRFHEIEIENDLLEATSHSSREIDLKYPCLVRCRGSVRLSNVFLARF